MPTSSADRPAWSRARPAGLDLIAIDAPHLYDRPGNPYLGPDGKDWPDNAQRFAALSRAAAEVARGIIPGYQPDVLHLHDWQAALAAVYVKFLGGPKTLLTVHNIAFQGQFPASIFASLQLPAAAFAIDGVEYYGSVSFLKGGLATADCHLDREPLLRPGDLHARLWHGSRWPAAGAPTRC